MSKVKQTALAVAGIASVFVAVSSIVDAASTYTVKQGDTLSQLADKFNVTVDDLIKSNDMKNADMIFVDQKIQVPDEQDLDAADVSSSADDTASEAASAAMAQAASSAAASESAQQAAPATTQAAPAQQQVASQTPQAAPAQPAAAPAAGGSTKAQFLAAGGTEALWSSVVMPESGGNANAVSPNGYRGLGQTKEGWGTGSVASQTQGMVNYANSRYGSIQNATAFRAANGWW